MDMEKLEQMGMKQGFSYVALLDCDTIELKPEVRQMCAADTCHKYDKCWSCPPGCGSLKECEAKVRQYKYGIIVMPSPSRASSSSPTVWTIIPYLY